MVTSDSQDARRRLPGGRSGKLLPYAVLCVGLLATLVVMLGFYRAAMERDSSRFRNAVESTRDRIQSRLDTYVAVLLATRGHFAGSDEVTREDFRRFVDQLDLGRLYPGIQGIGFARHFSADQREAVEAELRAEVMPEFHAWPTHPRDEWTTIAYLEPLDRRNRAALGYDMFTDPVRQEAMVRARDTGLPAASGRVTLVQEIDHHKQPGFLIYTPVYRTPYDPHDLAERREQLQGYVYAPFRMGDLLAGIFGTEREPRVSFAIYDGPRADSANLMIDSAADPEHRPQYASQEPLEFAGRTWTLTFHSLPGFESASNRRLVPYIGGFGVLVSIVLFALSRQQARANESLRLHTVALEELSEEREQLLEREHQARAQAEAASRSKDEFLAMLGHELRNPLAPIVTALELVKLKNGGNLDRTHQVIDRQVTHLGRLVDDLLDISRITRGKVELQRRPVATSALVTRAVELASPLLEQREHHLSVEVATEAQVEGDELRLAQVLANLLTNAAKYTEPGGHIEVGARREGDTLVISVRDDGIGIAPEMLPRIFDLFSQGERTLDRSQGGLGIGLTLVQRLVQAHGGEVEARSDGIGRGSEFVVRLPVLTEAHARAADATRATATPPVAGTARARLLVVDDNEEAAVLLAELLDAVGFEVAVAHDGPAALDIASDFRPALAILDIGLPVMDGYELASRLRELHQLELIAVSGYGQERDRERSREAGFSHHLVKPVDSTELLRVVAEHLGSAREAGADSPAPGA